MEAKLEAQERYEYKHELPTDGVCRVICSDSVASPTLSSCSLKERKAGGRGLGHKDKPARESGGGGEEYGALNSGKVKMCKS